MMGQVDFNLIVNSIGWTLLHSFWQAGVLAGFYAAASFLLKHSKASVRHNLGMTVLMTMIVLSAITFVHRVRQLKSLNQQSLSVPAQSLTENSAIIVSGRKADPTVKSKQLITRLEKTAAPVLNWSVLLWFLGLMVKSIQLSSALVNSTKIKTNGVAPVSWFWRKRLEKIACKMNIRKRIRWMESVCVDVPTVAGFFKPVILFPAGLFVRIPPDQIEALLIHELAHIARRDTMINMIQTVIDILFFFNPGVRFVSSSIRCEREHSCDDRVLTFYREPAGYARALADLAANASAGYSLNMAASGNESVLLTRIKRLFAVPVKTALPEIWVIVTVSFLLMLSVSVMAAPMSTADPETHIVAPVGQISSEQKAEPVLSGFVQNEDGFPLEKAFVKLTDSKDRDNVVRTDRSGNYSFTELKKGKYTMTVSAQGYDAFKSNIKLKKNKHVVVNATLLRNTTPVTAETPASPSVVSESAMAVAPLAASVPDVTEPVVVEEVPEPERLEEFAEERAIAEEEIKQRKIELKQHQMEIEERQDELRRHALEKGMEAQEKRRLEEEIRHMKAVEMKQLAEEKAVLLKEMKEEQFEKQRALHEEIKEEMERTGALHKAELKELEEQVRREMEHMRLDEEHLKLTKEQKREIETLRKEQLSAIREKINSPEFKRQMEEQQKKLQLVMEQMEKERLNIENNPEYKATIDEYRKKIEELQKSPEFKKAMEEYEKKMALYEKRYMEEMNALENDPEYKAAVDKTRKKIEALHNSPEFRQAMKEYEKKMHDFDKQMEAKMKALYNDPEFIKKQKEIEKKIEEVEKKIQKEIQKKLEENEKERLK